MSDAGDKNGKPRKTLKLKDPIQFGSETIDELSFRPMNAGDARKVQRREGYEIDYVLKLAGRLCGQPDAALDLLSMDDLAEVAKVVEGFSPTSPPTGGTPSES